MKKNILTTSFISLFAVEVFAQGKTSPTVTLASDKVFGIFSPDTVFTVTVTLVVFILGILIDRTVKYFDFKAKEKKLQQYFKYLLDIISDNTCKRMADAYKSTYSQTTLDSGILTSPHKVLTDIFQRVKIINEQELLNTFRSKESPSKIISQIEFLNKIQDEVEKYHKIVLADSNEIRKGFKDNLPKYFKLLAEYIDIEKNLEMQSKTANEFLPVAIKSFNLYYKEIVKTNHMKRLCDEIVRPIQDKLVSTNIFRQNAIAGKIAELGQEMSLDFYYLEKLTQEFCSQYEYFYNAVLDSQKILIEERAKTKWR
jgi:hypothetical protein